MIKDLKNEMNNFMQDIETKITNQEERDFILDRTAQLFNVIVDEMENVLDYKTNEIQALESKQRTVLVATADLKSGEEVTMDSFKTEVVQTTMDTTQIIEEDDFKFKDDKTGDTIEKYSEDGTQLQKKLVMKVGVPANSIVTKDMVAEVDGQTTDDQRIQEYNMIILPSELRNGDYVDIRVRFPKGQDYIVVAKKKI